MESGEERGAGGTRPDPRKVRLIMELRRRGITHAPTLAAIERTPREMFMPEGLADLAYADQAMPIACGQTISQPFVVALMTQALDVRPEDRVLEVGTGSGYQTAILASLAKEVVTIERWPELLDGARRRLEDLGVSNVEFRVGDGSQGAPDAAPFDRIIVTAAAPRRPTSLLAQLGDDGVLVAPVGRGEAQVLVRYAKGPSGRIAETTLAPVRFVPLVPGVASGA
jgi:protein-L-isoaspartate(D-aspartate) O-methyltransferase